jgi:hypothetical protein
VKRVLAIAILFCACGTRPPPVAPPSYEELLDDERRLSIAGIVLPRMPVDVEPDDPELEEGWTRASRALSMGTPAPPAGDAYEVGIWADEELTAWIRRRAEAIGEAQRALERARSGSADYSVVASAILGLAYSRFALDLHGISVPEIFTSDPERTRAFQTALRNAARPLWQRALDAFGSCASAAYDAPAHSLEPWREFCDEEIRNANAMLPQAPAAPVDPDDAPR